MSKADNPFRYFHSSPEIIRMVVMLYVRYPLSLRNVEDLLFERGYDFCHETVRLWWNRFGPMFAAEIRRRRVSHMRDVSGFRLSSPITFAAAEFAGSWTMANSGETLVAE